VSEKRTACITLHGEVINMKKIKYKYIYEDDDTGNAIYDFCTSCNRPVKQKDVGNGCYGCEFCKSTNHIEIRDITIKGD